MKTFVTKTNFKAVKHSISSSHISASSAPFISSSKPGFIGSFGPGTTITS